MAEQIDVEHIVRIHSGEGPCLEVGGWPEAPGLVELRAGGPEAENYYGKLSLVLTADRAKALGAALISVAETMK